MLTLFVTVEADKECIMLLPTALDLEELMLPCYSAKYINMRFKIQTIYL